MIINMTGGGGGSGGTLEVTAPAGVTVTATKGNKTYTRVVNAEGKATFKGLSSGPWMLSIDDATHDPSTPVPVEIRADYTVTLNFFAATINVTYPAGSTCTCADGNITLTAPDTSCSYTFTVPNAGTWTISSTNGSQSDSEAVSITADGQSASVTLSYFSATINVTYPAMSNCVVTDSGGSTVASDSNTGSDAKTWTATVTDTGTYTVTATATDGSGKTKSENISITTDGQSESVTLSYWDGTLYYNGNTYSDITGGYSAVPKATAPNSFSTDSDGQLVLAAAGGNGNSCAALTNNPINLTEFSTLSFTGYYSGGGGVSTSTAGLSNTRSSELTSQVNLPLNNAGTVSLDISGLSGPYYIGVWAGVYNSTVTISKIWLS